MQYLTIWLNIYQALLAKQLYDKESLNNTDQEAENDPWWNIKINIVETIRNLLIYLTAKKNDVLVHQSLSSFLLSHFNHFGFNIMTELRRAKHIFIPTQLLKFMF
jgi:hypothetical protein